MRLQLIYGSVEHLRDNAFQVLFDLLDEHRGNFLREVDRFLTEIYTMLLQEDLELKYQFESSGDLSACTFDSPSLLKICYSRRSSVEFRENDGATTFSDHDAPILSTPPIQMHAVQQSQMSRSAHHSPRPRGMLSPQIVNHDKNPGPAIQTCARARSASLPPPNSQNYSRIGTR